MSSGKLRPFCLSLNVLTTCAILGRMSDIKYTDTHIYVYICVYIYIYKYLFSMYIKTGIEKTFEDWNWYV